MNWESVHREEWDGVEYVLWKRPSRRGGMEYTYALVVNGQMEELNNDTDGYDTLMMACCEARLAIIRQHGSISGRVMYPDEAPAEDCNVTAYDSNGNHRGFGITDRNGKYYIEDLRNGIYELKFELFTKEGEYGATIENVNVTEPETTPNINVSLVKETGIPASVGQLWGMKGAI
jgi:hypothetical protein